jgi:mono/diheme cytochrome c family protein
MQPIRTAMCRPASIVGVLMWWGLALLSPSTGRGSPYETPTFNRDIAPILYANCVGCHRPGEVAPMSLLTFTDARPWARAMKRKVIAREMPPWYADDRFGDFSNRPRLTPGQIDAIAEWTDAGAPEGDGAPPAAPIFPEGWSNQMGRPPDQVIEAPSEIEVPAEGTVPTFTLWLRLPFKFDTFVEAVELRPSNRQVVHHASVSLGILPPLTRLGRASLWPGGPALNGVRLAGDGQPYATASSAEFGYPMLFYVPGGGFLKLPQGTAKRIRPGENLSWGMHLVTTGKPERVRMRLGLWFARKAVAHEVIMMTANIRKIVDGKEIATDVRGNAVIPNIPPGAENWSITGLITFPNAVTLYALWPHMHFRGKNMTFILSYPNGREETLLSVPRYDFHWQITYQLTRPVKIPARSSIRAVAHYDNSARNRNNPDPTQEVVWGEQSWNEMFNPFLEVSVDKDDLRFERLRDRIQ